MRISNNAKNRLVRTLHPLLRNDGTDEMASQLIQNVANDAGDEDGRWVTTEEGNHMFIDGEGVPTKGNPYVLAAAKGELKTKRGEAKPARDYPMGRSNLRSSGKYTRKQLQDEYKKLIDEKGGISKITNAESDEMQKKLGVSTEEWNNARAYWYAGPGSKKLQNENEGKSANSSKSAPANTSKPRKPAGDNKEDAEKYSELLETGKVNEVSSMMDDMPAGTIVQGRSVTMVKQEDGSWRTGSSLDYIGHKSITANEAAKKIAETNGRWGVDVNYPRVHEHNSDYDAPEFSAKSQKKKALKNVTPDDAKALVQRIEERRDKFRAEYKKVDDAYEKYVEEHTKPGMSEYAKLQVKNAAKAKHSLYSITQGYANESAEDFEIAEKWGNSFGSKRGVSREVYDLIHAVYYTNYARSIDKYEYA